MQLNSSLDQNKIELTNKIKRPLAYCRVSTAHQENGLAAQVRQVKEYCKMTGIEDVKIYTDESQSGAKKFRPGLDEMMEKVRS